jgi:hypothetical protein
MNDDEKFTKSECKCDFCNETHSAVDKWNSYRAENNLQLRALDVIRKLEEQNEINYKKSIQHKPQTYSREEAFLNFLGD